MDLSTEILLRLLENREAKVEVTFPGLNFGAAEIVESAAYRALAQIKAILEDDSLRDEECFYKIEEIVHVFERLGSGCGNRHDFG